MPERHAGDGLDAAEQALLLDLADRSILSGLAGEGPALPGPAEVEALPSGLRAHRGVFVTVEARGELNGCIGSLEAAEELCTAVPRLAWEAAFADPRLPPLSRADEADRAVKISVLSPLEALPVASEPELVALLRPGVDGLVIVAGSRRATFLPAVWATIGEPARFVHHLQAKAGLAPGRWPPGTLAYRYRATEFARRARRTQVS